MKIRQAVTPDLYKENQKLADALNGLAESIENGNKKDTQKNASTILKDIGSNTLINVLSSSVLELIKGFTEK